MEDGNYKEKRGEKTNIPEAMHHNEKRKETEKEENKKEECKDNYYYENKKKREMTEMEEWLQAKEGDVWMEFPNYAERAREINQNIQKEKRERENRMERAER